MVAERRQSDERLGVLESEVRTLKKEVTELRRQMELQKNRLPPIPAAIASLIMTGMGAVIGYLGKWVEMLILGAK